MRIPSEHFSAIRHARQSGGFALVITLAFLLVATIIVVAFLVRASDDNKASASYGGSVQSDLLAAGALDQVVANLLAEIADPANSTSRNEAGFRWMEPVGPDTFPSMLPKRVTTVGEVPSNDPLWNLWKQSIPAEDRFKVSGVSAAEESPNGRRVDARRWALPNLLGTVAAQLPADETPVPNWIYVNDRGESTTESDDVVGRFAYNVYDIGGLLNANVAGHGGATAKDVSGKGSMVLADLREIGLSEDDIQKIIQWRTAGAGVRWSETGSATDPINVASPTLQDYLRLGGNSGWLRNPFIGPNQGNQFFTRRDLIKFFKEQLGPSQMAALPFLTHFSVDVDAPSFSPDTEHLKIVSGGVSQLEDKVGRIAGNENKVNPPRWMNAMNFQTRQGTVVKTPLLRKRFPLRRLALVATDPAEREAARSTPDKVKKYFGLVQGTNRYRWRYEDAEGGTDRIKRLSEIPPTREPNFFEILKSVIQAGSLGQHKNRAAGGDSLEPFANRVDDHVLRVGAAIIDQADADSFPTCIAFNDTDGDLTSFGQIYGVEDVPYLYGMRLVAYRLQNDTDADKDVASSDYSSHGPRVVISQPTLWNPHNWLRTNYGDGKEPPGEYRITAKSDGPIVYSGSGWEGSSSRVFSPGSDFMTFRWTPANKSGNVPNFREPQTLLSSIYPAGAAVGSSTGTQLIADIEKYGPITHKNGVTGGLANSGFASANWSENLWPSTGSQLSTEGFLFGTVKVPKSFGGSSQVLLGESLDFVLEYKTPDGDFVPYDRLWMYPNGISSEGGTSGTLIKFAGRARPLTANNKQEDQNDQRTALFYYKTDPRSGRFIWADANIVFSSNTQQSLQYKAFQRFGERLSAGWYKGLRGNYYPNDDEKNRSRLWSAWVAPFSPGYTSINRKDTGIYYSDFDGVVRPAMGGAAKTPNIPNLKKASNWGNYWTGLLDFKSNAYAGGASGTPEYGLPMQTMFDSVTGKLNERTAVNRPIVLNRPFRSVGELAYAFRDIPWKNLDFASAQSGDGGLLDAFTVYENEGADESPVPLVANRVNLNTSSAPVLRALLRGTAARVATDQNPFTEIPDYDSLAADFDRYRSPQGAAGPDHGGPLRSLGDLVGRAYSGTSADAKFAGMRAPDAIGAGEESILQENLSASVRALADVGTTRTWNLMIDLVAQTGKIPPGGGLEKFTPSSESRWWLFVSIDRFTGEIVARSVERIFE